MKIVGQLKDSIAGLLTGTNLNNVTNLNGAIERAVRVVAQQVDVPESTGRQDYMFYNGVYDYLAPTAIFGGAILDLRPQGVSRNPTDVVYKNNIQTFDTTKAFLPNGYQVTFEYKKGTPIMRVAQVKAPQRQIIDTMNDTNGWTVSGDASGLVKDISVYYQSPASLRVNLAVGGSQGIISRSLPSTNLSEQIGTGIIFLAVNTPSSSALTSLSVRLGNDSINYIEMNATTGFLGYWVANEWTLIALDTSLATIVGTVDLTKISYTAILVNYDGTAMTNFRIGSYFVSLPSPHELIYQSASIFSAMGVLSSSITDDNDQIILNDAAYTLLEYEGAAQVCFQMGGDLTSGSLQTINQRLHGGGAIKLGLYDVYKADNPSQEVRTTGSYYD